MICSDGNLPVVSHTELRLFRFGNVNECHVLQQLFGGSSDLADVTKSVNHPKELKPHGGFKPPQFQISLLRGVMLKSNVVIFNLIKEWQ